jgi:hypothetical protein
MAPTFLVKALKRISALAFPDAKSRPSQDTIQLIAHTANGDLRSAINSLQFLSRSGESGNGLNAKATGPRVKASGKGSRGGKGAKLNSSEEVKRLYVDASLLVAVVSAQRTRTLTPLVLRLNAVARREQSLGLFHALGKVLYNKRELAFRRISSAIHRHLGHFSVHRNRRSSGRWRKERRTIREGRGVIFQIRSTARPPGTSREAEIRERHRRTYHASCVRNSVLKISGTLDARCLSTC